MAGYIVAAPSRASAIWTEQLVNAPLPLRVVHALSHEVVWAVGNGGQVVVTEDGGINWVLRSVPGAGNIRGLFGFDDENCAVADQMGQFWRTTDAGLNWVHVHSVAGSSINGIHFFDPQNGWAMGDPIAGHFVILESTNSGWSWFPSPNAPPAEFGTGGTVRSYDWVANQIGMFGTNQWVIWRTTNGGAQWDSIRTDIQFIQGVEFSDAGIALASGRTEGVDDPLLQRSTNFGQTWSPIQHPLQGTTLRSFDWIEGTSEVWGLTAQTGAFQSIDGGLGWTQFVLAPPSEISAGDIDFVDTRTGWCVGGRNASTGPARIFKYTNSTAPVSITPTVSGPARISISPNPFATEVTFAIEMPSVGQAAISIYDVGGRRILRDVLDMGAGGRSSYRWHARGQDGEVIPSGLYLYRVESGTAVVSGRVVKIR
jgi:photosystem II stability/assembly factor-like uncharacterized protein